MLHLITKKHFTKTKMKLPFITAVPVQVPFDPLTLAGYQAGYLMNDTTQTPPGSLDVPPSAIWFDATLLNLTAKYFQGNIANIPGSLNGFSTMNFNGVLNRCLNTPFDLFNGITNYCQLIGFQKNVGTNGMIFYRKNSLNTNETWIFIRPTGEIEALMGDGVSGSGNNISAATALQYNDGLPHCLFVVYSQDSQEVQIYTDLNEHITASNPAFIPGAMDAGSQFDIMLGQWTPNTLTFNPGQFGDIFFYSAVPHLNIINMLFAYECNRLGISYVPF